MIEFGTERTVIQVYRDSEVTRTLKQYRIKVKVNTPQDEMTEYIRFTDEIAKRRENGTLVIDRNDHTTFPAFILDYPRENIDGSYFCIKCYTVAV